MLGALAALLALLTSAPAPAATMRVDGLQRPVKVVRDADGVPHVYAHTQHDATFVQGWLHAQDRLFQMDQSRRQASGRLAELVGSSGLASDVQLRTLGLRRAAARSLAALSPASVSQLQAYADGVNAWVDSHPLPAEYQACELTSIPAWTPLDSVAVAKLLAFGLSFDLGDLANTQKLLAYRTAGTAQGFDGAKLFSQDVMRSDPFAHAPSIFPGETSGALQKTGPRAWKTGFLNDSAVRGARTALRRARAAGVATAPTQKGSNTWAVSDEKSASGHAMVANDPHLSLSSPSVFYEAGLEVAGPQPLKLFGVSFPGSPGIVQGTNGHVSWGSTVNPTDVTDLYQEQLVLQGNVPVATTYKGNTEPTQIIPETFRANQVGNGVQDDVATMPPGGPIPPATVIVPRRDNGPLISVTGTTGISVQYTGFSATRELDFFRLLARADTVGEAIDAQRYFDVGAQNWMYADDRGNIGYKTSAEIPLREDLQNQTLPGLPPWFIRDGTGGNEWIADNSPAEDQALLHAVLPFAEMDGLVNPDRGWISNANQDPTGQTYDNDPLNELRPGGGIRYISPGHSDGNRNARITARLQQALADGSISFGEMQSIQADTKLNDAAVLVPYITAALEHAQAPGAPGPLAALGADPQIQQAVGRLAVWDFSTPTGIPEGYDPGEVDGVRTTPSSEEKTNSVAASIYSLWRGQALALIVDGPLQAHGLTGNTPPTEQAMGALRHLLEGNGTGASGLVFFNGSSGRDTALLQAMRNGLDKAANLAFPPTFAGSTNQDTYRWGYLHRIVFRHPLGGNFSIPTGAGFTDLATSLPGIAADGGYSTVDAASHNPRASTLNGFMFNSGPARRFVAEARRSHPKAVEVIPGGESGNPFGPWFGNQLGRWLTDDYHAATVQRGQVESHAASTLQLRP